LTLSSSLSSIKTIENKHNRDIDRRKQIGRGGEGDIDKRFSKFEETLRELWKDGDKVYVSGTIINAIPFRIDTNHKSPHLIGEEIREIEQVFNSYWKVYSLQS